MSSRKAGDHRRRPATVPVDESRGGSGRDAGSSGTTPDKAIRQRIDEAMEILGSMVRDVNVAFTETHGGASRCREKSNPNRWGDGHSNEAKRLALQCKRLRRLMRFVHRRKLSESVALRGELERDGVVVGDVRMVPGGEDAGAIVSRLEGILECKRKKLHGRKRTQYILDAGGASTKSQEKKRRAATKRDVNAAMEKPVRGAIATVTIGAGDEAEVLTQPIEVAKECSEWGARCMSLMQPKWFCRLDVAVGAA